MNNLNRATGAVMHYFGLMMVLGFTATCTILFLMKYAPDNAPWLPYAGLAAFEFGAVRWPHYLMHNARNALQFIVAAIMTVVSCISILTCTGMEMVNWFSSAGLSLPDWIASLAFYMIIIVILANVFAHIALPLLSPEILALIVAHNETDLHTDARSVRMEPVRRTRIEEIASPTRALPRPQQKALPAPTNKPGLLDRILLKGSEMLQARENKQQIKLDEQIESVNEQIAEEENKQEQIKTNKIDEEEKQRIARIDRFSDGMQRAIAEYEEAQRQKFRAYDPPTPTTQPANYERVAPEVPLLEDEFQRQFMQGEPQTEELETITTKKKRKRNG